MSVSRIFDGLYLGNQHVAKNISWLRSNNIVYIVNIGSKEFFPADFKYLHIGLRDRDGSCDVHEFRQVVVRVAEVIDVAMERGEAVLVHCQAGMSRSPAVVVGWMVFSRAYTFNTAVEHVRQAEII